MPFDTDPDWPKALADAVTEYRKTWRAKMDEMNACIAANADQEELVDQPEVVKADRPRERAVYRRGRTTPRNVARRRDKRG